MISNLRDLGGITGAGNRKIRNGMLIRSASLWDAVPEDLKGISAVIDVRTPEEIAERPDKCFSAEYLRLPAFLMPTAGVSREEGSDEKRMPGMAEIYRLIVRDHAECLKKILAAIMEHDFASGAVLWHCSEGKDRTGIVAALVLMALGASREDIMEDYLKTNIINLPKAEKIRDEVMKTHGPEAAGQAYRSYIADAEYLSAALDEMGDDYITSRLGISGKAVARFTETLLSD